MDKIESNMDEGKLVRIFIGESDMLLGIPLYEAIVKQAQELKMAGATVVRGIMGFGATSKIHSDKFLRLSEDLPIIVELVDAEEKINQLMPFLEENVKGGLITVEKINVIKR